MTNPAAAPQFRVSPYSKIRDLAIVALCVAILGGFHAQVWRAPAPERVRTVAEATSRA